MMFDSEFIEAALESEPEVQILRAELRVELSDGRTVTVESTSDATDSQRLRLLQAREAIPLDQDEPFHALDFVVYAPGPTTWGVALIGRPREKHNGALFSITATKPTREEVPKT